MTRRRLDDLYANESGMSMVELIVYIVLSAIVMTIGVGIFVGTTNARTEVTSLTSAATTGQIISRSVEEGVRNAGGKVGELDPERAVGIKAETPMLDGSGAIVGQLMRARVAVGSVNGGIQWQCQAWYYSATTGTVLRRASNSGPVGDPGGFTKTNGKYVAGDGSSWLLLGSGVRLPSGVTAFFGAGSDRVVLRFEVTSNTVSLVLIPNTVVKRTLAAGGTGPDACY